MYGYAGRSAAAAAVPAFTAPPPATDTGGLGAQAASAAGAAAGGAHGQLSQLMSAIPQALQGAAFTPGSPAPLAGALAPLQSVQAPSLSQAASYVESATRSILVANDANVSVLYGQAQFARNLNTDLDIRAASSAAALSPGAAPAAATRAMAPAGSTVSAGVGDAGTVGRLAVPRGWVDAAPEVQMTAVASPDTNAGALAAAGPAEPRNLFGDMALASLAGRAIAGSTSDARRTSVTNADAESGLERLAGELTGSPKVQHWRTDPSGLKSLLTDLSGKPGVHEVHFNHDDQNPPKPGHGTLRGDGYGFWGVAAGGQLRAYVCRAGVGADACRGGGLGEAGR
jgi:hypothetical protein